MTGLFGKLVAFDQEHVDAENVKKAGPGIYIVYKDGQPFYVGRSIVSIYDRLYRHSRNIGSKAIAAQDHGRLMFEYSNDIMSVEQVEAELKRSFHTYRQQARSTDLSKRNNKGNLANVLDPAEKYPNPEVTEFSIQSDSRFRTR